MRRVLLEMRDTRIALDAAAAYAAEVRGGAAAKAGRRMSAPQEVGIRAALLGLRSVHKTVPVARIGERTVRLTQPVRALAGPGPARGLRGIHAAAPLLAPRDRGG